ncbi:MAG TPA: fibronectin type III domain-containing protein [Candidatus Eisenbacteria bacterium]
MNRSSDGRIYPFVAFTALLVVGFALPTAARAQINAYNSIGLEWTATGDDSTAGRASAYDLRYRTSAPSTDTLSWWNAATKVPSGSLPVPSVSGSTDSTRVTGLTPGTTYYFVLRAVDDAGNWSGYSNVASAATLFCDAPTTAPGSFSATSDTGRVDLSWSGSDPKATSVHVYRGSGSGSLSLLTTLGASATSYRDTAVQAGASYSYRVAWGSGCADGPSTSTESVVLPGTPAPPGATPVSASLHAYPNPSSANVQFVVRIEATRDLDARIRLFDMSGHWIATIVDGSLSPGNHTINWPRTSREGHRVGPGYYEAVGTVGDTRVRERIVLLP